MTSLSVEQLSILAPGLSPAEGRRLAQLLAEGLLAAVPPGAGSATIRSLTLRETAGGGPVNELARRLLQQITVELRRSL